jgi:hypothetical protein
MGSNELLEPRVVKPCSAVLGRLREPKSKVRAVVPTEPDTPRAPKAA